MRRALETLPLNIIAFLFTLQRLCKQCSVNEQCVNNDFLVKVEGNFRAIYNHDIAVDCHLKTFYM